MESENSKKTVVLRRWSDKRPSGNKRIHGIVFDHPSMPKIVTISSTSRETVVSSKQKPVPQRAAVKLSTSFPPSQHSRHLPREAHLKGHFNSHELYSSNYRSPENVSFGQYSSEHPPPIYSPALIHAGGNVRPCNSTSSLPMNSSENGRLRHLNHPVAAAANQQPSSPASAAKSQIMYPPSLDKGTHVFRSVVGHAPSKSQGPVSYSPMQATSAQVHRTQPVIMRRYSTGALRHHCENVAREAERDMDVNVDRFSRKFHLNVWQESHQQAASRVKETPNLSRLSGHNVETYIPLPRFRSLSTTATETRMSGLRHQDIPPRLLNVNLATNDPPSSNGSLPRHSRENAWSLKRSAQFDEVSNRIHVEPATSTAEITSSPLSSIRKTIMCGQAGNFTPSLNSKNIRNQRKEQDVSVVVISDDDDDDDEVGDSSPSSCEEDADVFPVARETEAKRRETVSRSRSETIENEMRRSHLSHGNPDKPQWFRTTNGGATNELSYPVQVSKDVTLGESNFYNRGSVGSKRICEEKQPSEYKHAEHERKLETSYRSVLYEREVPGQSRTERVVMSEQLLSEEKTRGTKRSLQTTCEFFKAGAPEPADVCLNKISKKIRRVSYDELLGDKEANTNPSSNIMKTIELRFASDNFHRSSESSQSRIILPEQSRQVSKTLRSLSSSDSAKTDELRPKIIRSKSHDQNALHQTSRFFALPSSDPNPFITSFSSEGEINSVLCGRAFNHFARLESQSPSPDRMVKEGMKSPCRVCVNVTSSSAMNVGMLSRMKEMISRDEFRCRSCDRVLINQCNPGVEDRHSSAHSRKGGTKPTGIVVGIKQASEWKQSRGSESVGEAVDEGVNEVSDGPRYADLKRMKNGKDDGDLGVLHFEVVEKDAGVKWENDEEHVKSLAVSRGGVLTSQQWGAYSLKLEQLGKVEKPSCVALSGGKSPARPAAANRNSTEDMSRNLETEFSSNAFRIHRALSMPAEGSSRPCNNIDEEIISARKRSNSSNGISEISSQLFGQKLSCVSDPNKRCKLSDQSDRKDLTKSLSSDVNSFGRDTITCADSRERLKVVFVDGQFVTVGDVLDGMKSASEEGKFSSVGQKTGIANEKISPNQSVPVSPIQNEPSLETTAETRPSDLFLVPSEESLGNIKSPGTNPSEVIPAESDVSSEEESLVKNAESSTSVLNSAEDEHRDAKNQRRKEELTLNEWKEILIGRIEQVKESIEEEKTPWKMKNKRKVLGKLERQLMWLEGPELNEAVFISKRLQFFQTMRNQYELMKIVQAQKKTMKNSEKETHEPEDDLKKEKPEVMSVKEVEVEVERKEKCKGVKKTVKCLPSKVKKGGVLMKKIKKAVVS